MGRTIPAFRIAATLEEKEWKSFRKYLNKNDKKAFDDMFSIARLYNSACSYASIPIRIFPIMMSIALHHYKLLKEKSFGKNYESNLNEENNSSIILKREIDKWNSFASIFKKLNRELFKEMLEAAYKYSNSINARDEQSSTESLIISILFEQYKIQKSLI
jgi:hypothetical protein